MALKFLGFFLNIFKNIQGFSSSLFNNSSTLHKSDMKQIYEKYLSGDDVTFGICGL